MNLQADHPASVPDDRVAEPSTVWEPLHPNARHGLRAGSILGFVLPYAPPAAILLLAWDSAGLAPGTKFALFLGGLALAAFAGWRLAAARFARTRFALDAAGLRIQRGVFWRSETLVPRSRVQHTDLNRGPLDRRFGLATLKVYTAGTKLASVALDGLPEARAAQLRDALVTDDDDAT
jgi:membrane protein YdbS with pleckstrin-like domain